jgi:polar amino acid transport system substrate-binding protein
MDTKPRARTFGALIALAVVTMGSLAAHAACVPEIQPQDMVAPGALQLSINPTNPPQQYVDNDGKLRGLNVEIADEIAKRLCVPINLVRMDFPGMIPAVKAGRLDGLNTGMFWNEERSKILYMVPYGVQGMSVIVSTGGTAAIKEAADLSGATSAVETNSYQQKWLTDFGAAQVAKGAKPITIRSFPTATDVVGALLAGQVDNALLIDSVARALVAKGRVREVITGLGENRMSMAFRNKTVADAVVKALNAMQADGTYKALFDKFGLTALPAGQAVTIVGPGPQ